MGVDHVESVTDLACRTALIYRTVAHITIPTDVQTFTRDQRSEHNVPHHTSSHFAAPAAVPGTDSLRRAAELLNNGSKVAILAGSGALRATAELEQTAELLSAPIIKALLGKASVPDDSPYTTAETGSRARCR